MTAPGEKTTPEQKKKNWEDFRQAYVDALYFIAERRQQQQGEETK